MATEKRRAPAGAAVLRDDITSAIRDAVMHELAVVGYARLSIEAVARRAGVSKAAVYRRWSSKLDLVLEIVGSVAGQRLLLPDTGSLTGDLEVVYLIMSRALRHPLASQIIPDLLAEAARNPQIGQTLQEVLRNNQQALGERLIGLAVTRGELTAIDPVAATDLIVGPLYWRLAIARVPLDPAEIPRLAAAVAGALQAACQTPLSSQDEGQLVAQQQ
ncbi:TetR/AcrR family transcriptional regulator [Micromonospora sp. DR5-3]|uniref:TetR/AcrR family transcriptional regulator n=1 Tax=unclassified Micromonospora TaxID=2617518 RepID=UPI0011DB2D64|nr:MULTISPECIES: TetR/AcrR family transcriptional regulator [unclassified Micromonospora]MCW3815018.1 TetR/AcrR family transcriptional regulator [Micromonospora sp. DR5-3]TYC25336.1 TetR/AcrR family transcriptional regulator [Micromonospora sp. MP36]